MVVLIIFRKFYLGLFCITNSSIIILVYLSQIIPKKFYEFLNENYVYCELDAFSPTGKYSPNCESKVFRRFWDILDDRKCSSLKICNIIHYIIESFMSHFFNRLPAIICFYVDLIKQICMLQDYYFLFWNILNPQLDSISNISLISY